jgi:hypothetical protein
MPIEAMGFVLGEDHDLQVARIHQVGNRKIDQAVAPGEGYSRFGPVCRQWHQSVSLATREDNGQDFFVQRHDGRSCTPS